MTVHLLLFRGYSGLSTQESVIPGSALGAVWDAED